MDNIVKQVRQVDWEAVADQLHESGYALVPGLLSPRQCAALIGLYDDPERYRKTVVMERYRFGLGEYKYFNYPLPDMIQTLRETLYPFLVPIANAWMQALNIDRQFPECFAALQTACQAKDQVKPTPLLLKYIQGGFNTLHQDLYGEVYFPLQTVFVLNEPDTDFTGGEFVLTQQIPRAQSRAIVLKPGRGDMLILTTNFLPRKGTRGYYRVNVKHGVSEVHSGTRHALGMIFHDAVS